MCLYYKYKYSPRIILSFSKNNIISRVIFDRFKRTSVDFDLYNVNIREITFIIIMIIV